MICYVLFLFSVFVSVTDGGGGANAAYKPTDVFLINCGASSANNDTGGRTWKPDKGIFLSSNSVNVSFSSDVTYHESVTPLEVPYMNARIFRSEFTYRFPVSPGWKFIRLYFYPTRYESGFDAVNSFFNVTINGFILLRNFSLDLSVKASISKSKSIIKEFIVRVDKTLHLTFTPSSNSLAFVNGVEIVSMPDQFYSKGGFDDRITKIGSEVDFAINNSTAFETVHRLNVGGKTMGEVEDSGMFRRWISDNDYFDDSGNDVSIPGVKINYTEKTPAYVAPYDVYAIRT